jgi:hypothetical protein
MQSNNLCNTFTIETKFTVDDRPGRLFENIRLKLKIVCKIIQNLRFYAFFNCNAEAR